MVKLLCLWTNASHKIGFEYQLMISGGKPNFLKFFEHRFPSVAPTSGIIYAKYLKAQIRITHLSHHQLSKCLHGRSDRLI